MGGEILSWWSPPAFVPQQNGDSEQFLNCQKLLTVPVLLLLLQLSVQQFFYERHALELEQLCVLFNVPVKRHADLPRPREDARVFDCRFVLKMIRSDARISFN